MMSEKEKEMEEEEEVLLHHWTHEHPLTLVETGIRSFCLACFRDFSSGEQGYECSKKCGYQRAFHQECAEMAMKIRHPMHPQHTLIQKKIDAYGRHICDVCKRTIIDMGYCCTSPECLFWIHIGCGQDMGSMDAIDLDDDDDDNEQGRMIRHGSHPQHKLRFLSRSCSFKCDACGTTHKGSSYVCGLCQYWINERCASLDKTMKREDHHHSLSLSFGVPHEYISYEFKCDVCNKHLVPRYWVYHCHLCRYAVHVKCAFKKTPDYTTINFAKDIIRFPMNDVAKELIRPFIMREGGAIAPIPNDDEMVTAEYEFHSHRHKLSLISSSPNDENDERENSDEDEDYGTKSEIICDGCITPIFKKNQRSSSSSDSDKFYYMSCSKCKYFLHYECFHLPPHLPSLPLLHEADHDLVLQSCAELEFWIPCDICNLHLNGLFYTCTRCIFGVDIKCASLPDTIYHAAHPQHLLKFIGFNQQQHDRRYLLCAAKCGSYAGKFPSYVCDDCEFVLDSRCVLLPASTKDLEWDKKHPLPLTLDARVNHPDEFYCNHCEEKMNPKMWMYHCRPCDLSFHPECFPATTGKYRNIKFGQKYVNAAAHPHPLTYQLLTTKRRCDECRRDKYNERGFHCASCNFFICFYFCGWNMVINGDIRTTD